MAVNRHRVLIVDDEQGVCSQVRSSLSKHGFQCFCASKPHEAMELLSSENFDLIIAEITMNGMGGLELLDYVNKQTPRCRVILMTCKADRNILAQAILLGAFDYLEKPFTMETLAKIAVDAVLTTNPLPHLSLRAAQAIRSGAQAREASLESVWALVRAVEAKDSYTRKHSEQVAYYGMHLGRLLNFSEDKLESIRVACLLHDVGKIGVPDYILTKAGKLTAEEFAAIQAHSALGADILSNISLFSDEASFVRYHHENWDGSGYPDGISGKSIPYLARVLRIADSIDAMLMQRSYKAGYPVEKVIDELIIGAGVQFDPELADITVKWCRDNIAMLLRPDISIRAVS